MACCERELGHYTRALRLYRRALAEAAEQRVEMHGKDVEAKDAIPELEKQMGRIFVTIAPADGVLQVDGRPLDVEFVSGDRPVLIAGTSELGAGRIPPAATFELLLDPGVHVFVLSKLGFLNAVVSKDVRPGLAETVEIEAKPMKPETRFVSRAAWPPAWIAFGIGATGVAAGAVSGIYAMSLKNEYLRWCPNSNECGIKGVQAYNQANMAAHAATGAAIAGGTLIALAMPFIISNPLPKGRDGNGKQMLRVTPSVGSGGTFMTIGGTW